MNASNLQVLVIAGCQRSGTTLLGQILGAHTQTFFIDEPDGLYRWTSAWLAAEQQQSKILTEVVQQAAAKYRDKRQHFVSSGNLTHTKIVAKAPNLTYSYVALANVIPRPSIVYPVRDARDVVVSMLKLKHVPIIENQIRHIQAQPAVAALFAKELHLLNKATLPDHIKFALIWTIKTGLYTQFENVGLKPLLYKYEDLVILQESVIRAVLAHCNLPYEDGVLNHPDTLRGDGPGNTPRQRSIDTQSVNGWMQLLLTLA